MAGLIGVDWRSANGLQSRRIGPVWPLCGSCDARDDERIRSRELSRTGVARVCSDQMGSVAGCQGSMDWLGFRALGRSESPPMLGKDAIQSLNCAEWHASVFVQIAGLREPECRGPSDQARNALNRLARRLSGERPERVVRPVSSNEFCDPAPMIGLLRWSRSVKARSADAWHSEVQREPRSEVRTKTPCCEERL